MLKKLIIAPDPFNEDTWVSFENVDNVIDILMTQFPACPETLRIYHNTVSEQSDVTPNSQEEINRLLTFEDLLIVVVQPAGFDPITWLVIAAGVLVAAAFVFMKPKIPNAALRNMNSSSSNNQLSDRQNVARPYARIPDIFGTVLSTPDLIAQPYKNFINGVEVEFALMCIGRGLYQINQDVNNHYMIYDGDTLISQIAGASVEVYGPHTAPGNGSPQLRIGEAITNGVVTTQRSTNVSGQDLRPQNDQTLTGDSNIWFVHPNEIHTGAYDFTKYFAVGDALTLSGASQPTPPFEESRSIWCDETGSILFKINDGDPAISPLYAVGNHIQLSANVFGTSGDSYVIDGLYKINAVTSAYTSGSPGYTTWTITLDNPSDIQNSWTRITTATLTTNAIIDIYDGSVLYSLDGVGYTILSVASGVIILDSPDLINATWDTITTTPNLSPTLTTVGVKYVGPFILDVTTTTMVFANIVAPQGCFANNGSTQYARSVEVWIGVTPIDINYNPIGTEIGQTAWINGSTSSQDSIGITIAVILGFTGRCSVRMTRLTPKDTNFQGTVVDGVKWQDLYAVSPVSNLDFGNVTLIYAMTYASAGALSVKERKLNCNVTRKINLIDTDTWTLSPTLGATNDAANVIAFAAVDPFIGRRQVSELDLESIYNAVNYAATVYGAIKAVDFCYTFDNTNLSFEETVTSIASVAGCIVYRRAGKIKMAFEGQNHNSVLLFNHRNKLPGSETRTLRFRNQDNYDGLELKWIDPVDDSQKIYRIPESGGYTNPKQVESIGIRNKLQAYLQAKRAWNKIRYQNLTTQFDTLQIADMLVLNDRILVADNTRTVSQDGQVLDMTVLTLTLSQPFVFVTGISYTIFLQHTNGSVEAIGITPIDSTHVVLNSAPALPLALDPELNLRVTYMIAGSSDARVTAFLVSGRTYRDVATRTLTAINYDDRYYQNDYDYQNGIVDINGEFITH